MLISMAKKGQGYHGATVTRRDGWRNLQPGAILRQIEWSFRVGARWVCEAAPPRFPPGQDERSWRIEAGPEAVREILESLKPWQEPKASFACAAAETRVISQFCGYLGPKSESKRPAICPLCNEAAANFWRYRLPRRLNNILVLGTRRERLDAITAVDVAAEGFPLLSPADFVRLYCAPRRPVPGQMVTRIRYAHLDSNNRAVLRTWDNSGLGGGRPVLYRLLYRVGVKAIIQWRFTRIEPWRLQKHSVAHARLITELLANS